MLDHIRLGVFLVSLVLLLVSIPVMAVGAATAWLTTDIIANILIVDLFSLVWAASSSGGYPSYRARLTILIGTDPCPPPVGAGSQALGGGVRAPSIGDGAVSGVALASLPARLTGVSAPRPPTALRGV
jgi:hypothetical protein